MMLLHGGPGDNEQAIGRHLSNAQSHQSEYQQSNIPLDPNPELVPFYFTRGKEEFSSTSYVNHSNGRYIEFLIHLFFSLSDQNIGPKCLIHRPFISCLSFISSYRIVRSSKL
jgi:hypothetical protein